MTDWQTARIVAMLVGVNSKKRTYDPLQYMANGADLKQRAREARERALPTGDELLMKVRHLGVQIIDNRKRAE